MIKVYKHNHKKLLPILLIISIIISLFFSFFMWIDPFQLGYFHKKQEIVNNSGVVSRKIDEIFKPTQIVKTDNNGNMKVYTNLQTNLTNEIVKCMKSWKMSNLRQISHNNKQTYESVLQQKNTIQLYYPDNIGQDIFNKTYHQHLMMSSNVTFSKIIFSQQKSNFIYLLNDNNYQVYKISLNKQNTKNIIKILHNHKAYDISPIIKKNGILFISKETFNIPQYNYLISNQTINTVLNTLFVSNGNVNTHHSGQYDYYYSGNKHVSVNNTNNSVNFEDNNNSSKYKKNNLNHNLISSYSVLNSKGLFQDVVHYFGNSENGKKIDYRYFIYSIPVFDKNYGNIDWVNTNNSQKISFSLTDLQVPLRVENNKVLPSSQTVLNTLINSGIRINNINQLIVGYKWIKGSKNQIITLRPQWFVMINHKWHAYRDLVK